MHSGHGFAYDTMRRAEVYSRHPHLEAAGQDSLALQHSLASSAGLDHQVIFDLTNRICGVQTATDDNDKDIRK